MTGVLQFMAIVGVAVVAIIVVFVLWDKGNTR